MHWFHLPTGEFVNLAAYCRALIRRRGEAEVVTLFIGDEGDTAGRTFEGEDSKAIAAELHRVGFRPARYIGPTVYTDKPPK